MDNQKRDLEKNLAKEIQAGQARVESLPNHVVRVTMTSQTAFDTDSANIKPGFQSTMDKLADVVVRYGKTSLTIVGHKVEPIAVANLVEPELVGEAIGHRISPS